MIRIDRELMHLAALDTAQGAMPQGAAQSEIVAGGVAVRGRLLLQIHDELIFEVDEAHAAALRRLVRDAMVEAQPLRVPLQVGLKQGASWGELSVVEEFVSQASQAQFAFDGSQI